MNIIRIRIRSSKNYSLTSGTKQGTFTQLNYTTPQILSKMRDLSGRKKCGTIPFEVSCGRIDPTYFFLKATCDSV